MTIKRREISNPHLNTLCFDKTFNSKKKMYDFFLIIMLNKKELIYLSKVWRRKMVANKGIIYSIV